MIKKQSLIVFVFLCANYLGFGQITITGLGAGNTYTQDFNTLAISGTSTTAPSGWSFSESGTNANTTYTAGTGSGTAGDTYSFGSTGNSDRSFGGLQSGSLNPTIGTNLVNNTGFTISDLIISYKGETWRVGDVSRSDRLDFQYSTNATSLTTGTWADYDALDYANPGQVSTGSGTEQHSATISSTISGLNIADGNTFWIRWKDYNASGSDDGMAVDDFSIYTMGLTDEVDWCNLQFPATGTINQCGNFNVYARAYEAGVTNTAGANPNITSWIGYSTTDATTTADFTSSNWTWVQANYNVQVGNDDEYKLNLGNEISTPGTYYYVSRFQYNGGPYKYGGYNAGGGNFWDGSSNVSGILNVLNEQVNFCNVEYPKSVNTTSGSTVNLYAQVYEPGITDAVGQDSRIQAWIGYNTIDINHQPWVDSGSDWTWIPATYNPSCLDCNSGQNDEYYVEIGCDLPAGTYYYASRFQINCNDYSYGGITSDNVGNFWALNTINSGTLTVTDPPLADVVITEIMYNSTGTDDEWIEICNMSGSTQDLSNYIIEVGGLTKFTFPCETTINNNACITIDLGNGSVGVYNDDCNFTTTYSNGLGNGTLGNTSGTITLRASNGATSDTVTYNNGDGANGNGSSLHVIDATQDNSDTGTNWQEVAYGGSSGLNSLLPNCLPAGVEINVEGNLGNYPDIMDGDATPVGTDNTLFAAQFVGASQSKTYRIQSLLETDVTISSITITGHTTDFTMTSAPASPILYLTPSILEITFSPTVPGTRTAVVHIFNNDADEGEYTFTIQGDGKCIGVIDAISPASGPEGTIVTVSATGIDLNSATVTFNGVMATTVNYISATDELEVTVPNGASDGNLELVDGSGCTGIIAFDVIDNKISSCDGVGGLSDLIISEITDATTGGMSYIEIYNGTGSAVSLNGYSLEIISNGASSGNTVALNNVMLANDDTYVVAIGVASSPVTTDPGANTCPITDGNGELADQTSTVGGINKKDNEHDMIRLVYSGSTVDEFGVYQDNAWMDSTIVTGNRGFNFRRLNTASPLPNPIFNINDWNVIDWVGQGLTSCSTNDYSDIGVFDFSTGTPPSITTQPIASSSTCDLTATLTVEADEGFVGSNPLAYQWYYSKPGDVSWTIVPNSSPYSGETTNVLDVSSTLGLNGYQYYCQVRENTATCYKASNAVRLDVYSTTWNGTTWSNGAPTLGTIATINGDYDTASNGDFSACSLIVNNGFTLNIADGNFVEVENDLTVNGNIIVQPKGSFVQNNDLGTVDGDVLSDKTKIVVNKNTASPANNWYEYTYWSSPVEGETIADGLFESTTNRRFIFNAQNYLDHCAESNNDNNCIPGFQDNIDDDGNDWQWVNGATVMKPGVGYASTHDAIIFGSTPGCPGTSCSIEYTFNGPFNNGIITVPVYRNDSEFNDNNSNFIGNPYPSTISADDFFDLNVYNSISNPNGTLEGAIYLWSQNTQPSSTANGNQKLNFSEQDYAIINAGTGNTAGGDKVIPDQFIPSGQGFFVDYSNLGATIATNGDIATGEVIFNNAMRVTGNNNQFFKASNSKLSKSNEVYNKLWVNLTSDVGVFNQILVGYVNGATNDFDGIYYDVPRNLTAKTASALYSLISDNQSKYVIQGKDPNSLNLGEVIPLGFYTAITGATLYKLSIAQFKGDFFNSNTVYLKDNLMNTVHKLSESDYTFTSEIGEFNNRFEIVFQSETLSNIEAQLNSNKLTVIELNDGRVKFKTNSNLIIKTVKIFDVLGRTLYQLKGSNSSEIYNLSNLSQSTYIAKVELSNGQIVTKKALKRI